MVAAPARRRWSGAAVPEVVPRLRTEVCAFAAEAGVPDPPLTDVVLALSEALTNVVVHGYRDRAEPGDVDVVADVSGDELRLTVGDDGVGMTPRTDSPGLGVGLPLITSVADGVEIRSRAPHGTELHISFAL